MTDGVVLPPSAFSITFGCCPSTTAKQLFVVPKSIPIIFDIIFFLVFYNGNPCRSYNPVVKFPTPLKYIFNFIIFFFWILGGHYSLMLNWIKLLINWIDGSNTEFIKGRFKRFKCEFNSLLIFFC